jgi:tetratricopeptide (TPR) repeat protein
VLGPAAERPALPQVPAVRAEALIGAAALAVRSGRTSESAALAGESLEIGGELGDQRVRCRALQVLGVAAWSEDDLVEAKRIYEESLAVATAAGIAPARAAAMHALGIVCWYARERERADELLTASLDMFRALTGEQELAPPMLDVGEILMPQPESGGVRMVFVETFAPFQDVQCRTAAGYVLANQGMLDLAMGDHARARARMEESLALFEAIGDERAIGQTLGRLGILATAEGDLPRARESLTESLEVRRRIGDTRGMTLATSSLGNVATAEGDYARARELLDDSVTTFRRRGDLWGYASALGNRANLALAEKDDAAARRLLEESLTATRAAGRARWIAWTEVQLAAVTAMQGDRERAGELAAGALATFQRLGDQFGVDRCLALLGA